VFEKGWPYRQGTFERRGDSDWYRVALAGGRNYAFAINVRNVPTAARGSICVTSKGRC
jgi:hypothetical protein